MQERFPNRSSPPFSWGQSGANFAPLKTSFDGKFWHRTVVFFFDIFVLFAIFTSLQILNLLTYLMLSLLFSFMWHTLLLGLYDTVLISGRGSATLDMRLMELKPVNHQGNKPNYLQAFVLSALFYLSVSFTFGSALLVALFNNKGRCLHDIVTFIFIVNAEPSTAKP
ncbi:MAG: RDD family protein [Alphaproteobacteria bacterium]